MPAGNRIDEARARRDPPRITTSTAGDPFVRRAPLTEPAEASKNGLRPDAGLLVKDFVGRPGVALDTVKPPYVPPPFAAEDGGDQVHTDGGKQYMFFRHTVRDMPNAIEKEDLALTALRSYVVDGHIYFVAARTPPVGAEDLPFPNLVLLWAVGVSPASGHLIGCRCVQACHNLGD